MLFQFAQPFCRLLTQPLPKLVALIQQSSVAGVRLESLVISHAGLRRLLPDIAGANPQVPPNDRKFRIEFCRPFPKTNRLIMATAVIEQIAKIIWSPSVHRI